MKRILLDSRIGYNPERPDAHVSIILELGNDNGNGFTDYILVSNIANDFCIRCPLDTVTGIRIGQMLANPDIRRMPDWLFWYLDDCYNRGWISDYRFQPLVRIQKVSSHLAAQVTPTWLQTMVANVMRAVNAYV